MAAFLTSRLLRRILIALLLLLCLGVCELWLFAANRLARDLHRPSFGGASLMDFCASSEIAGFPFRLKLSCANLAAPIQTAQGIVLVKAEEAKGQASIFAPHHVLLSVSSPVTVEKADGAPFAKLRHDGLSVDLTWSLSGLVQGDLDAGAVDWRPESPDAGIALNMRKLTASAQPSDDQGGSLHVELGGDGIASPALGAFLPGKDLGQLNLSVRIAPPLGRFANWSEALEDWRQKSGAAHIETLEWRAGRLDLSLAGDLGLDEAHRPSGHLTFAASGAGPLLAKLGVPGSASLAQGLLGALAGPKADTGSGKPGGARLALPLTLAKGQLFLGPIRLPPALPPLY